MPERRRVRRHPCGHGGLVDRGEPDDHVGALVGQPRQSGENGLQDGWLQLIQRGCRERILKLRKQLIKGLFDFVDEASNSCNSFPLSFRRCAGGLRRAGCFCLCAGGLRCRAGGGFFAGGLRRAGCFCLCAGFLRRRAGGGFFAGGFRGRAGCRGRRARLFGRCASLFRRCVRRRDFTSRFLASLALFGGRRGSLLLLGRRAGRLDTRSRLFGRRTSPFRRCACRRHFTSRVLGSLPVFEGCRGSLLLGGNSGCFKHSGSCLLSVDPGVLCGLQAV